jgi:hypothetical protein
MRGISSRRGADRVGAAVLLPVDAAAQGQGLSGGEVEEFGVFLRHVEGHCRRILGEVVDGLHGQRVEARPGGTVGGWAVGAASAV